MVRETKKARSEFSKEWERGIAFAKQQGASAGAIRALRAHADADVEDTAQTLRETADTDIVLSVAVFVRWRQWYPSYVMKEVTRLLPELSIRWPGERARWKQKDERRKLDRWCSDGEDILNCLGALSLPQEMVRRKLRLQKDRFERLKTALVALGAIRVWSDGRMHATAGGSYVRDQLRARWLWEGSDAPDWVDPLPIGTRQRHKTDSDSLSEHHHTESGVWRKG